MVKEFLLSKTFAGILLMFCGYFFGGEATAAVLSSNPDMINMVTTILISGGGALATFGGWSRVKKAEDLRSLVDSTSGITDRAQDEIRELKRQLDAKMKEVDSLKNNPPSVEEAAKVLSQHARNRKQKTKNPIA